MLYEHRLYDLRGSFATDIYKATEFDIVATTAALGNTDTRSTIKYVRVLALWNEPKVLRALYPAAQC